jgi:citrate lyase subunit beta/citryl-CoA lyase
MVRRSLLFSPGDEREMLYGAPDAGPDTVVFDLEDAVAPDAKARARETVRGVLTDDSFDPACEVCVRVNPGAAGRADVEAVAAAPRLDAVMLPKVERAADVAALADRLAAAGRDLPVLALVESARGVLAARAIAAVEATDALCFGAEDLAADLGAVRTPEGTEIAHARRHVVLAARAENVAPVDTVYTDYADLDGLREEARAARTLGYGGKMAIHPEQVAVVNEAFSPDSDQVEWAERVLAARDEAAADGRGVFVVDGEMIDAPLVKRAERIVTRHRATED